MRLREQVYLRDRGVCALCGRDTDKLKHALNHLMAKAQQAGAAKNWKNHARYADRYNLVIQRLNKKYGWPLTAEHHVPGIHLRLLGYWEADHDHPRSEGGPDLLDNLRTLCVPCHREVTRDLHKMRRFRPTKGVRKW